MLHHVIHYLNGLDTLRFISAGDKVYSDIRLILYYCIHINRAGEVLSSTYHELFHTFFFQSNKFLKEVQSNFFNFSEPQVCPWWPLLFLSLNCVLVKVNFPPSRSVSTLKIDIFLLLFIWSFIKQVVISLPWKQMRRMLQKAFRHGIIELVLRTVMYLIRYFSGFLVRRLSDKSPSDRKLVPTNRCRTWGSLDSHTKLRIWVWISLADKYTDFF